MHTSPEALIAQTTDLVSLPHIYLRVKGVMEDPETSMADLTAVVSHDPALIARLLKLANSAFFGFTTKIDTIDRAVNLLGAQQIHDLVLATTVADAFSKMSPHTITMHDFWTDSIHCGLLAKSFGSACGLFDAERFFVEGLLYDLGHLILDQCVPEACAAAFERAHEEARPVHLVEREMIGCDYAQVGAALMKSWSFPGGFVEAVRWQNEPAEAAAFALEAAVMHTSVTMLRADRTELDCDAVFAILDPSAVEVTEANADILSDVRSEAAEALTETVELLFPQARLCA